MGETVIDTREVEWEETAWRKRMKTLSRFADGQASVYLAWLPPGPYLGERRDFRHYHHTVREIGLHIWGELRQWEYENVEDGRGELIRWREGMYMDRKPGLGSIHGFVDSPDVEHPIGYCVLHIRSGTGNAPDDADFEEESPEVPYPDDREAGTGGRGPSVTILDTRAVEWELWPGMGGVKVKPLSRFDGGEVEVCLLWLPPGEGAPRQQRHRTAREHFYVLGGEMRSGDTRLKEGAYVERDPGTPHASEPESASSVGCVLMHWRTAPGTFPGEPAFEQETELL